MPVIQNHVKLGALLVALTTLIFAAPACSQQTASFSEERVTIEAGDITLAASLYRPKDAKGDLPAIVTAHGSAPSSRDDVMFYTRNALDLGFAVLSFDKRGVGDSTGTFEAFNVKDSPRVFDNLAMDVVWSVRWLAQQDGIDESRIGLFGGSQAGWIMPLAASKEPLVHFIIIGEGVPLSAGEEAAHENYLLTHSPDAETYAELPITEADKALYQYEGITGYDPAPVLEALDIPILWFFGLRDWVIPVTPSISRLEALINSGHSNHEVHVFAFGDHNFTNRATGERYDLVAVMQPWLKKHGFLD